jgi:hypothetical protein
LIVGIPLLALVFGVIRLWPSIHRRDVVVATVFTCASATG